MTVAAILGLNLFLSSMQDSALDTGIRRELRVQAGRYFPLQALLSTTTLQQESERLINPDNPSHPNEAYLSIDAEPVLPVIKNEARLRKTKRTPTEVKTGIHSQKSLDASERASDPDQQVDISRDPSMTTLV